MALNDAFVFFLVFFARNEMSTATMMLLMMMHALTSTLFLSYSLFACTIRDKQQQQQQQQKSASGSSPLGVGSPPSASSFSSTALY
tara:strand:+ start:72 stop:329 length:258 start_codon:yes stop_codon:yes gene_type:complete